MPFPELKREADVVRILGDQGIKVPHIHSYCADPPAILMEALPGIRDVSAAKDDAERARIVRQYVDAVAAMHAVPVEPYIAMGLDHPQSAEEIALAGVKAYIPLYLRKKVKPDPLIAFALGWIRRNAPQHRT
jgi:aminoglycoside phosphotransferase (APT) family kinase protein